MRRVLRGGSKLGIWIDLDAGAHAGSDGAGAQVDALGGLRLHALDLIQKRAQVLFKLLFIKRLAAEDLVKISLWVVLKTFFSRFLFGHHLCDVRGDRV